MEQRWWTSGTVMVEQWNSETVIMEQMNSCVVVEQWKRDGGTVEH